MEQKSTVQESHEQEKTPSTARCLQRKDRTKVCPFKLKPQRKEIPNSNFSSLTWLLPPAHTRNRLTASSVPSSCSPVCRRRAGAGGAVAQRMLQLGTRRGCGARDDPRSGCSPSAASERSAGSGSAGTTTAARTGPGIRYQKEVPRKQVEPTDIQQGSTLQTPLQANTTKMRVLLLTDLHHVV